MTRIIAGSARGRRLSVPSSGTRPTGDRVRESLSIYAPEEIAEMTTDEGIVTADCQFCGAHYEFDPASLGFEATVDAEGNPVEAKGE